MRRLQLVTRKADKEIVDALAHLLDCAKRGEIVGIAYISMKPGHGYEGDVLGYIRKHRLLARGIVEELKDLVTRLNRP